MPQSQFDNNEFYILSTFYLHFIYILSTFCICLSPCCVLNVIAVFNDLFIGNTATINGQNEQMNTVFSVFSTPGALKIEKMTLPFYPVISAPLLSFYKSIFYPFFSKRMKTFFFEAIFSNSREKSMTFSPVTQKSYLK